MEIEIDEKEFKAKLKKDLGSRIKPLVNELDFRVETLYDFLFEFYSVDDLVALEEYTSPVKEVGMALLLIELAMYYYTSKPDQEVLIIDSALNTTMGSLNKKELRKNFLDLEIELTFSTMLDIKLIAYYEGKDILSKVIRRLIQFDNFKSMSTEVFQNVYSLTNAIIELTNERLESYNKEEV